MAQREAVAGVGATTAILRTRVANTTAPEDKEHLSTLLALAERGESEPPSYKMMH